MVRNHKLRNSWGVYDAYRWIRRNKWFNIGRPLTTKEFYSIIRAIGKIQKEDLVNNLDVEFPYNMGRLSVEYKDTYIKFVDGKLKTNRRIDWKLTNELGYRVYQENKGYTYVRFNKGRFVNSNLIKLYNGKSSTRC